jgi:hypothetical protein
MRIFSTVAGAVCLSLLAAAGSANAAPDSADGLGGAAVASKSTAMTPTAAAVSDAAAKKHAKRTACLKDAKSKKLVGADKTAFIKNCIATP